MSIHYKFNTALQFDTVTFDGLHISLKDLKKQISSQKKIGKDYDLQVTNAQTKEIFKDDNELISKNSSLIVARVPVANQLRKQKQWDRENYNASNKTDEIIEPVAAKSVDISSSDLTEEDKIKAMMSQSTSDYDPSNYLKMRGQNQVGPVPPNYICFKCHQRGHWIRDCPANAEGQVGEIKKSTGIPRSFMVPVEGPQVPGARVTPSGEFVASSIDLQVYKEKKIEKPPFLAEKEAPVEATVIPEDLQCSICKDLMQDAVMAPCCGNSFCDECIRNILVESDDAECPECNEKEVSPDTLIPNRFVRSNVNNFKNKTGYIKRAIIGKKNSSPPRPTLPDFIPPVPVEPEPSVENSAVEKVEKAVVEKVDAPVSSENTNNDAFLYDIAVEKDQDKKRGDYRAGRNRAGDEGNNSDTSSESSKDSYDPSEEKEEKVYAIPSLAPNPPANVSSGYRNSRNQPNFMSRGQDRCGTPTVDERYDMFGRGGPPPPVIMPLMPPGVNMPLGPFPPMNLMGNMGGAPIPPPLYNPNFPPPMVGPPGQLPPYMESAPPPGYPPRGLDYPRDRDRHRPYRGRNLSTRMPQPRPGSTHDNEEAFRAFERMLQEKEERDKWKLSGRPSRTTSHSRSRSPRSRPRSRSPNASPVSTGRRRSFSPKRSRSRSKSARRSRSPSPRSRSRSYVSRSRSRSYSKSPPPSKKLSPKRYASPHRSPNYRYDRSKDYPNEGNYGWDRQSRRGFYAKTRQPHQNGSPQRQYNTYNRYNKDGYGSPPRGHTPDRYGGSTADSYAYDSRAHSSRWNDRERDRYRRRSRSRSHSRDKDKGRYFQEEGKRVDPEKSLSSKGWNKDLTPEDRHKYRDDRSSHFSGKNKYRDSDREQHSRRRSIERRNSPTDNRRKSPVVYSRDRKSCSPSKHIQRRLSVSPKPEGRNPSPVRERKSSEDRQRRSPSRKMTSPAKPITPTSSPGIASAVSPEKLKVYISESVVDQEPLARNPSPAVTEDASEQKKEKKKDKDKKKRKKEKETEEEKDARRKRKREKKEKKRLLEQNKQQLTSGQQIITANDPTDNSIKQLAENESMVTGPVVQEAIVVVRDVRDDKMTESLMPVSSSLSPTEATPSDNVEMELPLPDDPNISRTVEIENVSKPDLCEDSDEDALDINTSYENLGELEVLAPVPELSRWELEESDVRVPPTPSTKPTFQSTFVTTEVLKRAENAIFKKAISALQPLKKNSGSEKSRLATSSEKDVDKTTGNQEIEKKSSREETIKRNDAKVEADAKNTDRNSEVKAKDKRTVIKDSRDGPTKRVNISEPGGEILKFTALAGEPERVYKEIPIKGKQDKRKPTNSIQITIPVVEKTTSLRTAFTNDDLKSPPNRVSAKDRLGGKVDHLTNFRNEEKPGMQIDIERSMADDVPNRELTPEEKEPMKVRRDHKKSPEPRKRTRSSSETSEESVKKKKKRSKHKKEKRTSKKSRREVSSSFSSDSEVERKKSKKSKKKKKSRH